MKPCKKCGGVAFHFLTCPLLNLQPGWRDRITTWTEGDSEDDDELEPAST